jgi:hypothetical protein
MRYTQAIGEGKVSMQSTGVSGRVVKKSDSGHAWATGEVCLYEVGGIVCMWWKMNTLRSI